MLYKRAFWCLLGLGCAYLGFSIRHDSYNVFLAIAAVLFSYGVVSLLAKNRAWMLLFFIILAVTMCQTSVFARARFTEGSEEEKPIGVMTGDVAYGFNHILKSIKDARLACAGAINGNYDGFNLLNYRFVTMGLCMPLVMIIILLKKPRNLCLDETMRDKPSGNSWRRRKGKEILASSRSI
jgi:hypothetical protein